MSDEFDNLDANEKAALGSTLIGVACLWVGSGKNSVRKSLMTRGRLQAFTSPLSALPGSSNRKQRRTKERSRQLEDDTHPLMSPPTKARPVLRVIEGGLSNV